MEDTVFTTKEEVLQYVRERNHTITQQGNNATTGDVGTPLRGYIQGSSDDSDGIDPEGYEETRTVYGRDDSIESEGGSSNGFASQLRQISERNGRSDGGSNQYQSGISGNKPGGTDGTAEQRPTFGQTIKSKLKPYKQSFNRVAKVLTEKTETPGQKKPVISGDKKLTDTEAIKLRPKLITAILWQSEHLDQFITATSKGHEPVEIWSNMDEVEAEILADFLIARGKANAKVARAVRNMATLMDKIKLGLIILPRAYRTMLHWIETGFSLR